MMMEDAERAYELTAKTDLWTGDAILGQLFPNGEKQA